MELSDSSVASYERRLDHWTTWCAHNDVDELNELEPWDIGAYEDHRRARVEPVSLNNELTTLRQHLRWAMRLGLVDETVVEAVDPPKVPPADQVDETLLTPSRGEALLRAYRGGDAQHSREHALLEVAWWTGARLGALRGLDLGDVDFDEGFVQFQHRPDTATPLKNGRDGERIVGLGDEVVDAVRGYVNDSRPRNVVDAAGRRPLFATTHGRISTSQLRDTCYYATVPCRATDCPHGEERTSCGYYSRTSAHGCPSSRSPHQVRSGSITWQLNRGLRADVVSDRVNATVDVIERHYDQARQLEEFRERREQHLDQLRIDEDDS